MAEIIDIADAVVTELNATNFSQSFTAVRAYLPDYKLEDMDSLHVTVVPKGAVITPSTSSRAHQQHDFQIDVAVQKRGADILNATLDALSTLVEEIADHFRMKHLPGHTSAVCITLEYAAVYDPEHLQKFRQFTSLLTLTFRKMR